MSKAPYGWQQNSWQLIRQAADSERLHHAYNIVGLSGLGKWEFANHFAKALLCTQPAASAPCGDCPRCAIFAAGTHPDLLTLDWIAKSRVISVEQIRKLTEQLMLTTTYGPYRIAIINKAHTMTRAAANSLLKTLEEPGAGVVIMLLSDNDAVLPVTIRSRCQRVVMPVPPKAEALDWLKTQKISQAQTALEFSHGAPLRAKEQAEVLDLSAVSDLKAQFAAFLLREVEPSTLAASASSVLGTRDAVTLFMQWTTDLIKKAELSGDSGRSEQYEHPSDRRYLCRVLDKLQHALRLDTPSLKTQTVLEGVLADIKIIRVRTRAETM